MRDLDVGLHEVRGALTVIRGQCFSMARGGAAVEQAGLIDAEIDRILEAIEGMAGRPMAPQKETPRVRAVVAEVVLRHLATAERRGVSLRMAEGAHDARLGEGSDRLRLALDNLVQNAIRHCGDGGEVVIEIATTRHGTRVTVRNEGEAPSPDDLRRAFEPGVRGPTPKGEGWGLGLAIASRAVAAFGGSITAHPVAGGCAFEIDVASPVVS